MIKEKKIPFQKRVWCHVRMYQSLHDIPNERLAQILAVGERTLHEYDKKADNITLEKIDNFLSYTGISFSELMSP